MALYEVVRKKARDEQECVGRSSCDSSAGETR